MNNNIYILLGSNLGDREHHLNLALKNVGNIDSITIEKISSVYETEPIEMNDNSPRFLNQVIHISFQGNPLQLLSILESIEQDMGRINKGDRTARIIDLDILLFDKEIVETDQLTIPHRELKKRQFALIPLLELNPNIIHPVDNYPLVAYIDNNMSNDVKLYRNYGTRSLQS